MDREILPLYCGYLDWCHYNFQSFEKHHYCSPILILPSLKYAKVYVQRGLGRTAGVNGITIFSNGQNCPSTFIHLSMCHCRMEPTVITYLLPLSFPSSSPCRLQILPPTTCAVVDPVLLVHARPLPAAARLRSHARRWRCLHMLGQRWWPALACEAATRS